MPRLAQLRNETAVVTGASSGIGLHFCRHLAAAGCHLVMVSNEPEPLEAAANQIEAEFGVTTFRINLDLTRPDAAESLMLSLERQNIVPLVLINNAGIFSFNNIIDTPPGKMNAFVDLHVRAVTHLSRTFAAFFAERGRGYILNMSSMSCWMPMPGIALYAATKAYIRVFSRALHYEMRPAGVGVTVACPGGIATDLFGLPHNLQRLAVRIGALQTPEKFTRKALRQMMRRRAQYINGWLNRFSIFAVACTPRPIRMLVKSQLLDKGIRRP